MFREGVHLITTSVEDRNLSSRGYKGMMFIIEWIYSSIFVVSANPLGHVPDQQILESVEAGEHVAAAEAGDNTKTN